MAEEKKILYHYTDKDSAEKIKQQGVIKPSEKGAFGGDKVYATSMSPSHGRKAIAKNNYDGVVNVDRDGKHWEVKEKQGSVDNYIKLEVPADKVTKEKDRAGRDIYTIKGAVKLDPEDE